MKQKSPSALHLVVHPGYATDPEAWACESTVAAGIAWDFSCMTRRDALDLLDGDKDNSPYLPSLGSHLATLATDEAVIVISHVSPEKFQEDVDEWQKLYAMTIRRWQETLHDRMILVFDPVDENGKDNPWNPAFGSLEQFADRWRINRRLPTIAYGESLQECLPVRAHHFNQAWDLRNRTTIDVRFTDYAERPLADCKAAINTADKKDLPGQSRLKLRIGDRVVLV